MKTPLVQLSIPEYNLNKNKINQTNEQKTKNKSKWLRFQLFLVRVSNYKTLGLFDFNSRFS